MSKLQRSGSSSSLASLTSRGSQKIHVPQAKGADFLDVPEVRDRGTFVFAPIDVKRFKKINQNVQPQECVPEPVRNKRFNRHMDVLPNPDTRVKLPETSDDATSAYINANFIHGPDGNAKAYICAMGPLPATLKNWWRMIWQEKVTCILMTTGLVEKGTKKCERYWAPRPGQKVKVADMFVRTLALSQGEGYVRTLLEIEHSTGETRKVMHFWYNTWGNPDATNLLYMIRDSKRSEDELGLGGPVLTHCSAGVGRSGTVIALDFTCQLLEANGKADLNVVVEEIRKDRVALVQHPQQYELAHAGACLYTEFVQANLNLDKAAIDATFFYDRQAFVARVQSTTLAAQSSAPAAPAAVEAARDNVYGVAVAPQSAKAAVPTVLAPVLPRSALQEAVGNLYGTAVAPTAAAQTPAPPTVVEATGSLYGAPVLPSALKAQPAAPPAEYAVMKAGSGGVPVARELGTYEDAKDEPNGSTAVQPVYVNKEEGTGSAGEVQAYGNVPAAGVPARSVGDELLYGDGSDAAPTVIRAEPAAPSTVVLSRPALRTVENSVVRRAEEEQASQALAGTNGATASGASSKQEEEDDSQFGFEPAAPQKPVAAAAPAPASSTRSRDIAALRKEIEELELSIASMERDLRNKGKAVSDADLAVRTAEQRADLKAEQLREVEMRARAATGTRQAAEEEIRRNIKEQRTQALVTTVGHIYTKGNATKHAQFLMLCLQPVPRSGRSAQSVLGRRQVASEEGESATPKLTEAQLLGVVAAVCQTK